MKASLLIPVFLIGIVLFVLLRQFWCWYFKINERISLQNEQNLILREILTKLKSESIAPIVAPIEIKKEAEIIIPDEELMTKYGIAMHEDSYVYGDYKYSRLIDAVNYAKLSNSKKESQHNL